MLSWSQYIQSKAPRGVVTRVIHCTAVIMATIICISVSFKQIMCMFACYLQKVCFLGGVVADHRLAVCFGYKRTGLLWG